MLQIQLKTYWLYSKSLFLTYLRYHRYGSYIKKDFSEYFQILKISEDSDQHTARESFLKLAKIYHPDSNHPQANSETFHKIENAYKNILEKFSQERRSVNDCEGEYGLYYEQKKKEAQEEEYDIKHTAPQHRQYLSFEGIGIGTPSQRQKQFTTYKAMRAAENIVNYKVQKLSEESESSSLVAKDIKKMKNIQTRYGIDRLVEDKIQESMARGDFDNLPNAGKPLKFQNYNPFVDNITHKLNEVLIDNGYAPEWVMLEREIRQDKMRIKKKIENCRCKLGPCPLTIKEKGIWTKFLSNLKSEVEDLNKKIDKYNLVVPIMSKQTVHFPFVKVCEKILHESSSRDQNKNENQSENTVSENLKTSNALEEEFGFKTLISILKGR
ncbi:UNVERIFIED_CONTAM: hypothetical protein RMT77_017193 [Armadillidium vulgare]